MSILPLSHCTKIHIYPKHLNTWQNVTLCECETTEGSQFISICYIALSVQGVSCPPTDMGHKANTYSATPTGPLHSHNNHEYDKVILVVLIILGINLVAVIEFYNA